MLSATVIANNRQAKIKISHRDHRVLVQNFVIFSFNGLYKIQNSYLYGFIFNSGYLFSEYSISR